MIRKLALSILLLLTAIGSSMAQGRKEFTEDAKVYIKELEEFMKNEREEVKLVLDDIIIKWKKGEFGPEEQRLMMEFSNTMLRAKMKASPDFNLYMKLCLAYKDQKIAFDRFELYHEIAEQLLNKSRAQFGSFTETCQRLFGFQELTNISDNVWKVSSTDFDIEYKDEAIFTFPKTDIQLFTNSDTLTVYATKGKYFLNTKSWHGEGGEVRWTRVGFSLERMKTVLKNYRIPLSGTSFNADSVLFYYPAVFDKPILGRLEERAMEKHLAINSTYPRFHSYGKVYTLKNLFKDVDYRGGFSLEGAKIIGRGSDSSLCSVTIKRGGKVAVRAISTEFTIAPDKISSSKTSLSFYLGKDSIYHTQVNFSFSEPDRQLRISREKFGVAYSPFFDSYHKLEYRPDNMVWNLKEDFITMVNIINRGAPIEFESIDFFDQNVYAAQQGIISYNPLRKFKQIVGTGSRLITEKELEGHFSNTIKNLQNMLFSLAGSGFIFYDQQLKTVYVKDKLLHYIAAFEKKNDYDRIKFESVISGIPNGTIDLNTFDMKLEGVRYISVSDSQNTYYVPHDQKITIKKNREIDFGGQVHSGRFDFFGEKFSFNYEKFLVQLTDVDSVRFVYPEIDSASGKFVRMRTIQTTIQDANGVLYIDNPANKSGTKNTVEYPIFECNKESYVYYDKAQIFDSAYDRKRFYFKVNPFKIENLDNFTAEGLEFPGTFYSGDIIPNIKNALKIQKDYSLGFATRSPEPDGFPLYKGKGKGKGYFHLSNQGFRGNAEVTYLASTTKSTNIVFFLDSMNSISESFEIPLIAKGKYPPILGKGVFQNWRPYMDSMYIYKRNTPISVYEGKIDFSGSFILTPAQLLGNGTMAYQNLNVSSERMAFLPENIKSKDGSMFIKSPAGSRNALEAKGVEIDLDLVKEVGKFELNSDTSVVELPTNKFNTTLNTFTYDVKEKKVEFAKSVTQSEEEAYFVSQNPGSEELKIKSTKATYTINDQKIKAEGVPYISIADSKIITPDKKINIEKEGILGTITNAEVITSEVTENHRFYEAKVNIQSKTKFTGEGYVDYIDKDKKAFKVKLTDIRVNDAGLTIATGKVLDSNKFYLTPSLKFTGIINILGERKPWEFEGLMLAEVITKTFKTEPVKIKQLIDPELVVIELGKTEAEDGGKLYNGIYIDNVEGKMYSLLLGRKLGPEDHEVMSTTGVLVFDDELKEVQIGKLPKIFPDSTKEAFDYYNNTLRYSLKKKQIYAEGLMDLGVGFKHMPYTASGQYRYSDTAKEHKFKLAMALDMPFHPDAAKILTDNLLGMSTEFEDAPITSDTLFGSLTMMIEKKKDWEKINKEIVSTGTVPNEEVFDRTFVFNDLNLVYADTITAYISAGPLGFSNIKGVVFNKQIPGGLFIRRNLDTDPRIIVMIEPKEGEYTMFNYFDGDLEYLSADLILMDKITETIKKLKKIAKGSKLYIGNTDDYYFMKANILPKP